MKKSIVWIVSLVITSFVALLTGIGCLSVTIQNSSLKSQNDTLNKQVSDLNNAVGNLQDTIDQFEYQVALVSYEVNGNVEYAEVVQKGASVTLPTLDDTETQYFNGWKINGVGESLWGNYTANQSTYFVADMVNKAVVTLVANGEVYDTEYVIHGNSVYLPTQSDTDTTYYNGWQIDGQGSSYKYSYTVQQDLTFVLDMKNKAVVTMMASGEVYDTKYVIHGNSIMLPTIADTETHYFNGWQNNGDGIVYNGNYVVNADVVFVLDFKENPIVTYIVDNEILETKNVKRGTSITLLDPVYEDTETHSYVWKDQNDNVCMGNYSVADDVTFVLSLVEKILYQRSGMV